MSGLSRKTLMNMGFGSLMALVVCADVAAQDATRPADQTPATRPAGPAVPPPAPVEQPTQDPTIEELRRRLDLLAGEVERLRSGETTESQPLTEERRRALGLGPAAAAVYERKSGVSFAGYGEMLFQRQAGSSQSERGIGPSSSIDWLRAVLYSGYRFNDRFLFNSEFEWEHGGDEVGVEFAYLDFAVKPTFSVRGGMLLVPLGLVNEFHEPTVNIGARRPETERRIIPTTWHENGAGVVGSAGPITYRAYLLNGLNAAGFAADGLREGRQGGAEALANDWAFAGRADVNVVPGVLGGVGLYRGNSGQGQFESTKVGTTIAEVHGQAQVRGFDLRGVFAHAALDGVAALNAARGFSGAEGVGRTMNGGYAQVAYNVLSQTTTSLALSAYYRFEHVNTQASVAPGFLADPSQNGRWHTFGVELKPISHIVVKTDYQRVTNQARTGRNQFNILMGYSF
jgi:hypothetical protein